MLDQGLHPGRTVSLSVHMDDEDTVVNVAIHTVARSHTMNMNTKYKLLITQVVGIYWNY